MKFLSNVLKTLSTLELYAEKKRPIPNGISKHFIHLSIYELFYCSPRKKQNWNNRLIGQLNSNFFNKELVSSFFPVNLSGGQFFVTAEDRHLWNVSETLREIYPIYPIYPIIRFASQIKIKLYQTSRRSCIDCCILELCSGLTAYEISFSLWKASRSAYVK